MSMIALVQKKQPQSVLQHEEDGFPNRSPCRTFWKRETVFRRGCEATYLYRVKSGVVALELFLKDGRRQLTELVLPGDLCGFGLDGRHCETGVAMQFTVVSLIKTSALERSGVACLDIARQASRQMARSHEHILALGRMSAEERVCHLLDRLAGAFGKRCDATGKGLPQAIQLRVPLTRGEIGDYLGLSLETVCRTMTTLQKQGLLRAGPHHGDVTLLDLNAIQMMARGGALGL